MKKISPMKMNDVLKKVGRCFLAQFKKLVIAIPAVILLLFVYVQCTKIGSKVILETSGIKWYVHEDSKSTKEDLAKISNMVFSTLYENGIETKDFDINIILCSSSKEFKWKSLLTDDKCLGASKTHLGTVIINRNSIENNKMDINDSRLSETLVHELCHVYMYKRLSFWDFLFLETWKSEGFSEFVSNHSTIDMEKGLSLFLSDDKTGIGTSDYDKSIYFYFVSRLKTTYLLGHKKISLDEFVNTKYDDAALEKEIRDALKSGEYEFLP